MKAIYSIILAISLAVSVSSCDRQNKAESLVDDFMEANMKDASVANNKSYTKIDSTAYINDSIVTDMRSKANGLKLYRTNIKYAEGGIPKTIYYIRVSYLVDGKSDKMDKKKETFYFDRELTRIIAFK